jgi:two-component system OmpR family sensor kinase
VRLLPRGIRVRLALALLLVVGAALGVAYVVVVPSLERRLVDEKLDQLEQAGVSLADTLPQDSFIWQDLAEAYSFRANARVVIYQVFTQVPPTLAVRADSRTESSLDIQRDPLAEAAVGELEAVRGTLGRSGRRFAEVAVPLTSAGPIVLFVAPLDDSLSNVRLVERRLLVAGGITLLVALLLGYFAAALHAERIRRLERAAERIADGSFEEPVVDRGADELGELADAFERMRVRLSQLDRARSEFIANASHELRTPLFSLGGFLELMDDEDLDDETRQEFVTTMREQVDRLGKLATDLLDLSRLDTGRLRIAREEVDLAGVARLLGEEFRVLAGRRGHPLVEAVESAPLALGDEDRVLQIGRALIDNALTHTPPGTRVTLRAGRNGRSSYLAVEDEGPGVPPEHAAHVFERFYRVDGGVASGSGLGLAIARELASLMDGRVRLDSVPGRTVFRLELPPARSDVD